jgi:hypothetical protein
MAAREPFGGSGGGSGGGDEESDDRPRLGEIDDKIDEGEIDDPTTPRDETRDRNRDDDRDNDGGRDYPNPLEGDPPARGSAADDNDTGADDRDDSRTFEGEVSDADRQRIAEREETERTRQAAGPVADRMSQTGQTTAPGRQTTTDLGPTSSATPGSGERSGAVPTINDPEVRRAVEDVSLVERGVLDTEDFAVETDASGDPTLALSESGERALVEREVQRDPDVNAFDPSEDIEQVGDDAYRATVEEIGGDVEKQAFAFSEEGAETLRSGGPVDGGRESGPARTTEEARERADRNGPLGGGANRATGSTSPTAGGVVDRQTVDEVRNAAEGLGAFDGPNATGGNRTPSIEGGDVRLFNEAAAERFGDGGPSIAGIDEAALRKEAEQFDEFAREEFGDAETRRDLFEDVTGVDPGEPSDAAVRSADAQGRSVALFNPAGAAVGVIETAETAGFVGEPLTRDRATDPETLGDAAGDSLPPTVPVFGSTVTGEDVSGAADRAEDVAIAGGAVLAGAADYYADNPGEGLETAGAIATGAIVAGGASGSIARQVRDRVRTAGATRVDAEDLTNRETIDVYEGAGSDPDARFPGADDPDLYEDAPAEAVRAQADEFTTDDIEAAFAEGDVEGSVTLKKALDVEPEGPESGRAAQGFESAPGESLEDFDYETPGSFVGPELSPNFLGLGASGSQSFSLRPGLPDTGNSPTGLLVRTDVAEPDADTLDEFNEEMIERAGETTARTKPAGEVNAGEIEAVIPPGTTFGDAGGGAVRNTLRRAGVGSDFYTELGGRRVPLRPVRPDDRPDVDVPDDPLAGAVASEASSSSGAFSGRTLDDLVERVESPTDRPAPLGPTASSGAGRSDTFDDFAVSEPDVFDDGRRSGGRGRDSRVGVGVGLSVFGSETSAGGGPGSGSPGGRGRDPRPPSAGFPSLTDGESIPSGPSLVSPAPSSPPPSGGGSPPPSGSPGFPGSPGTPTSGTPRDPPFEIEPQTNSRDGFVREEFGRETFSNPLAGPLDVLGAGSSGGGGFDDFGDVGPSGPGDLRPDDFGDPLDDFGSGGDGFGSFGDVDATAGAFEDFGARGVGDLGPGDFADPAADLSPGGADSGFGELRASDFDDQFVL